MAIKKVCDCCGKGIVEPFMLFKLIPYKGIRVILTNGLIEPAVPSIVSDELCNNCAEKLYSFYRGMKTPVYRPNNVKRVCSNCGQENDHDIVCPICGKAEFKFTEGDTSGA